jgi:hypothetical protein
MKNGWLMNAEFEEEKRLYEMEWGGGFGISILEYRRYCI